MDTGIAWCDVRPKLCMSEERNMDARRNNTLLAQSNFLGGLRMQIVTLRVTMQTRWVFRFRPYLGLAVWFPLGVHLEDRSLDSRNERKA